MFNHFHLVHIPKTAGTSLSKIPEIIRLEHRLTGSMAKQSYPDAYFIAVSRNPYDRFYSIWKHFNLKKPGDLYYESDQEYIRFCKATFYDFKDFALNVWKTKISNLNHFKSMTEYLFSDNTLVVDRVLSYYNLQSEIELLLAKKVRLPCLNKMVGLPLHKVYTPEIEKVIYETYKHDFKNLGFKRGQFLNLNGAKDYNFLERQSPI